MNRSPDAFYVLGDTEVGTHDGADSLWLSLEEGACLGVPAEQANAVTSSERSNEPVIDVVGQLPGQLDGWTLWLG